MSLSPSTSTTPAPERDDLLRRLARATERVRRHQARLRRRLNVFSALRFVSFAGACAVPAALFSLAVPPGWALAGALPGLLAFLLCFALYSRLEARREAAQTQTELYEEDRRRVADEWWRQPPRADETGQDSEDTGRHPYADDLQLFGNFSVFQFLNRTATPIGQSRLAQLLRAQPDEDALEPERWQARRDALRELADRRIFRVRWRREGRAFRVLYARVFDMAWIREIAGLPPARLAVGLVWLARVLPALTLLFYIGHEMHWTRAYHLLTLPAQIVLFAYFHVRFAALARLHGPVADQLSGFDALFRVAAGRPVHAPALRALSVFSPRPAREVRTLASLAGWFAFRRNPLLHGLAGIFLLHEAHAVFALGRWQQRVGAEFAGWFSDLALLDAWQALASPMDTDRRLSFPDLGGDAALDARELAHPLLPAERRVANDLCIDAAGRVWILTGSNMSGKSTFLRAVGLAALFAQLGAPVAARQLRFRTMRLVTSMNQRDDLARSVSLFYAEVRRIKILQDLSENNNPPALLLIDEMLRGTNARERTIASQAILRGLLGSPSFALVATHDMDLVRMSDEHPAAVCYHFQEVVSDHTMSFDYRLRPGPVRSSNALRILEMEGVRLPPAPGERHT